MTNKSYSVAIVYTDEVNIAQEVVGFNSLFAATLLFRTLIDHDGIDAVQLRAEFESGNIGNWYRIT